MRACVRVPVNEFVLINRLFSVDHPCHSTAAYVVLYCFAFVCLFHGQLLFFLSFFRCPMFMLLSLYSKHELFLQLYLQRTAIILLASFVSYCYCMPLVTSNKNKIKWATKAEKKKTMTTTTSTSNKDIVCSFDTLLCLQARFHY